MIKRVLLCGVATVGACLVAPAAEGAAASPPPVVQINIDGKLRCSGAVVAPRFVLTTARCASGRSKVLPASRLSVRSIASSKVADRYAVAGVTSSPTVKGGRPALALLQVATELPNARLRLPSTATRLEIGRRTSIRGWRSAKRLIRVNARVVTNRSCRIPAKRRTTRCLRYARRAPSRRCSDAAGAVYAPGSTVAGFGTRGSQGCRKRALPLRTLTAALGRWAKVTIAATTAPSTAPQQPGTPARPSVLSRFVGTWSGNVIQREEGSENGFGYPVTISIARDGAVGQVLGSSSYPTLPCDGALTYRGPSADGGVVFGERITSSGTRCLDGGTITFALVAGQPAISYTWRRPNGGPRVDGVLPRR